MMEESPDETRFKWCCGYPLEPAAGTVRCPACGSEYHLVSASDKGKLSVSEDAVVVSPEGENVKWVRQVSDSGRDSWVERVSEHEIQSSITARPQQNERNVPEVARILRERLNRDGGNWAEPEICAQGDSRRQTGVDFILRDGTSCLYCQVVRTTFPYYELAQGKTVNRSEPVPQLADGLKKTITGKAQKIGPRDRCSITLVVDSIETAQYVSPEVAEYFRRTHGEWASSLGFAGIWIVGPTSDLTHKLV